MRHGSTPDEALQEWDIYPDKEQQLRVDKGWQYLQVITDAALFGGSAPKPLVFPMVQIKVSFNYFNITFDALRHTREMNLLYTRQSFRRGVDLLNILLDGT